VTCLVITMDDLRRRFATLDTIPTQLDWAEVERRGAAVRSGLTRPASVSGTSVTRVRGRTVGPSAPRSRGLVLLVTALLAALVAGVVGFGGLLDRRNVIVEVSPSPTPDATLSPTDDASITPTPSVAAAACPGVEAPPEPRITELPLPGKTTAPLGEPTVAGCAIWVPSGQNGGGIHRIDLATGKVTNSDPTEVPSDIETSGDELWAIGTRGAVNDGAGLSQLDPSTGATLRELPLSTSGSEMVILDGRAWLGGWRRPLTVVDLASGNTVATLDITSRGLQLGAGAVWTGLSRIDPFTFEVTELQTTFPANQVVFVADRMYAIDHEHGEIARLDPVSGSVLTSVQVEDWSAGLVAVERGSMWILQYSEPPVAPLKLRTTTLLRIDATTGQIAERIPLQVVFPVSFYATDGNLWIVDQPSRLRHGFIRIELPDRG
jgi:hypothetical protein